MNKFAGFLNQVSNRTCFTSEYNYITLHTNSSIANNKRILYWTRMLLVLETDAFSVHGHEHFWRWRQNHFALETESFHTGDGIISHWRRTLVLVMNAFKMLVRTLATCAHVLYIHKTSDFQAGLMSWWLLLTVTHVQKWVLSHCGNPKGTCI